jgi:hypothetical protein
LADICIRNNGGIIMNLAEHPTACRLSIRASSAVRDRLLGPFLDWPHSGEQLTFSAAGCPGRIAPSDIENWSRVIMTEAFQAEVVEITSLVQTAALPGDVQDTVVWCLRQLPAKYARFCETYESRYAEEILRLEQGILEKLTEWCSSQRDRQPLQESVLQRLHLLNERYSLPGLVPKPSRAARVRSRTKAK